MSHSSVTQLKDKFIDLKIAQDQNESSQYAEHINVPLKESWDDIFEDGSVHSDDTDPSESLSTAVTDATSIGSQYQSPSKYRNLCGPLVMVEKQNINLLYEWQGTKNDPVVWSKQSAYQDPCMLAPSPDGLVLDLDLDDIFINGPNQVYKGRRLCREPVLQAVPWCVLWSQKRNSWFVTPKSQAAIQYYTMHMRDSSNTLEFEYDRAACTTSKDEPRTYYLAFELRDGSWIIPNNVTKGMGLVLITLAQLCGGECPGVIALDSC